MELNKRHLKPYNLEVHDYKAEAIKSFLSNLRLALIAFFNMGELLGLSGWF